MSSSKTYWGLILASWIKSDIFACRLLNRKLKEEIEKKRKEHELLMQNGAKHIQDQLAKTSSTAAETTELPILHLVFICTLTLVIGILTGKLL